MRLLAITLCLALVGVPAAGLTQPASPLNHVSTASTSTEAQTRLVWMSAADYLRLQENAAREREKRIKSQGKTSRAIAGVVSCRKSLKDSHEDIAEEEAARRECERRERELAAANEPTLWDDIKPWLYGSVLAGVFIGGVVVGLEAGSD